MALVAQSALSMNLNQCSFDSERVCQTPCTSPSFTKKNVGYKAFDESASTDTGGEDLGLDVQHESSSDGETVEDSRAHDSAESDLSMPMSLVYSLAMMMQVRLAVRKTRSPSPVQPSFATRPTADCPAEALPAPAHEAYTKPKTPLEQFLSKATTTTCDALYEDFALYGLQTPEQIWTLVKAIFAEAQVHHDLIPMYANLLSKIEEDPRAAPALTTLNALGGRPDSFRRLLLGECQEAFEQLLVPHPEGAGDDERARLKQRSLGGVKFVGQLLVDGMLPEKLLVKLLQALLSGREACPDSLESLVALMSVTGEKLDVATWRYFPKLEAIFAQVKELAADKKVPSRARTQLTRLLFLRKANWHVVEVESPHVRLSADALEFVPQQAQPVGDEINVSAWGKVGARVFAAMVDPEAEAFAEEEEINVESWGNVGARFFVAMVATEDQDFLNAKC